MFVNSLNMISSPLHVELLQYISQRELPQLQQFFRCLPVSVSVRCCMCCTYDYGLAANDYYRCSYFLPITKKYVWRQGLSYKYLAG